MSALAKKSTTPLHRNDREALKEQIRCCAYELYTSEAAEYGTRFPPFSKLICTAPMSIGAEQLQQVQGWWTQPVCRTGKKWRLASFTSVRNGSDIGYSELPASP
jgi:hypothetical protein